jgi:hypothetical protein
MRRYAGGERSQRGLSAARSRCSRLERGVKPSKAGALTGESVYMAGLAVILLIVGIVLLLLGIFVEAVKFLLWIGVVILVLAVIAWLMRFIRRQT